MNVSEMSRPAKRSGVITPNQPRWHQRLGALLLFCLVRLIGASIRFRWHDRSGYFTTPNPGPAIYCFWHNRVPLCTTIFKRFLRPRRPAAGMAALVSASKDGGFLSAILTRFDVEPVRGSTSRRGPQALLELTTCAQNGYDLAITPDGPRGPCYEVQEGVMHLAQLTGLPIIPVGYYLGWKVSVSSWDRLQIPYFFSRCEVTLEQPIRVHRDLSAPERETLRLKLEQTLRLISRD